MHCSGMLWHPDVATQLVLASEDDRLPVIQMWDLRFATSPLKVLENHTRWDFNTLDVMLVSLFFCHLALCIIFALSLCFLPEEFCLYPGARLTLNSCWVVLKTTGSSAGIQTLERYMLLLCHPWTTLPHYCGLIAIPWIITGVLSSILGHLWASNNKPVVLWCPVVPQESSPAFSRLIWRENHSLLCHGRELEGSTAKHSW